MRFLDKFKSFINCFQIFCIKFILLDNKLIIFKIKVIQFFIESPYNEAHVLNQHASKWVWGTFVSMCFPELLCFFWCLHRIIFRNTSSPTLIQFLIVRTVLF